ncbi:MAG: glutamate-5-semialdehyde dehydrogenase [Elusimicrobiota bacterium]|nr:glutamate-5-semialdehyde dehydrogenase [Elusimicrobiota bacterium]
MENLLAIVRQAKAASYKLATVSTEEKNFALRKIAENLTALKKDILAENQKDIKEAITKKLSKALIDRLTLTENRLEETVRQVITISKLPDPIGKILSAWSTPSGLKIQKIRVPLGVILMIYESRPNVTVDSSALCIKSGNAVILRGGSEAINSNRAITKIIKQSLKNTKIPQECVTFISSPERKIIYELIQSPKYIDLVIPRGGEKMIQEIRRIATVPVLAHGKGLCHTYVDKDANLDMATKISYNAKVQRPGVCNAMETLLVHKQIAKKFLPQIAKLYSSAGVQLRVCKETKKILQGYTNIRIAKEIDYFTEYLDLILSIKIVNSVDEAIKHINKYGSGHSDAIITENKQTAEKFLKEVDSSAVFHNASTRLHDGGIFGLGSEIGISTQKLHARGTMGLNELTTTKYVISGTGQIRE